MRRRDVLGAIGALPVLTLAGRARAATPVSFLLPAPVMLPVFAPHQLAKARGYFADAGLEVTFTTGRGGADVAKQVAVGNADFGTCLGEVTIVVRANGLPIRNVALLGGRPLFAACFRHAVGAKGLADLRGRRIGVPSFEDSSYYALLGVLAALKIRRGDVNIQSVNTSGVRQLMISGDLDGIMGNPDDIVIIRDAGAEIDVFPIDAAFPGMAQVVVASDDTVKSRPQVVTGVARALVRAVQSIIDDPARAARDYVAAVPQNAGKEAQIERSMRLYVEMVYKTAPGEKLGEIDPRQLDRVQKVLLETDIIHSLSPLGDLYSNLAFQ